MNIEVKKCADNKDIKGLKYIFVDCLDVDPTFEKYKEEYGYCSKIPGFLEEYIELTPLLMGMNQWNEEYWVKLKVDLLNNFSEKRFTHMIAVAKVVKADKVKRLVKERKALAQITEKTTTNVLRYAPESADSKNKIDSDEPKKDEDKYKKIELENREIQKKIDSDEKARYAKKAELIREENEKYQQSSHKDLHQKKVTGIVLIAMSIIVIVAFMIIMQ